MGRSAFLALAAVLTASVLAFVAGRGSVGRVEPSFRALTFREGFVFSARFLPDGTSAVYGAGWGGAPVRVHLAELSAPEARTLELPPADVFAVSRKGELLLGLGRDFRFDWLTESVLAVAPFGTTGSPREVARRVRAADWAPDGERVAMARAVGRENVLEFPPGRILHRTSGWIGDLRVLADGDRVAFLDHPIWGDRRGRLSIADANGARALVATDFETLSGLAVPPGGHEVYFSAAVTGARTEIFAAALGTGRVRPLLRAPGAVRVLDVSASGRVLLSRDEARQATGFRRGGGPEANLTWTGQAQVVALSPDGAEALLTVFGERAEGTAVTWLRGTREASMPVRLGEGEATDLSPDGLWAVAIRHGEIDSLVLHPTGSGDPRTVVLPRADHYHWARFGRDGRFLVVSASEPGKRIRLYRLDLETGDSGPVTPEGVGFLLAVNASGTAVTSQDLDGKLKLFPLEGGAPTEIPGLLPGEDLLAWLPGDASYLAARRNDIPLHVFQVDVPGGARRLHTEIGPVNRGGLRGVWPITFSRDGSAVAYNVSLLFSELFVADDLR